MSIWSRIQRGFREVVKSPDTVSASRKIDVLGDAQISVDQALEIIAEKQASRSKVKTRSKLDIRDTDSDMMYGMIYAGLRSWFTKHGDKIPHRDDPSRDEYLSIFWKDEPILAGAVYSMVAKMSAMRWAITGRRLKAKKAAQMFAEAAHFDGYSWDGFISSTANNFYTVNRGVFWETVREGSSLYGKLSEIGHIDSLNCNLTGNKKIPMLYMSDTTGQTLSFRRGEYIHFVSLPSPRERDLGLGFCAVDRAWRAAKLLTCVHDYDEEKLVNLPPEGIAAISGLTMNEFMDALALWKAQRQADHSLTFPQVLWLIGSQPQNEIKVSITGFSQLPESFERDEVASQYISTLALCFGVDAREFWPISSGALGTASESEIQHLKAKGKGPGEFISLVERNINGELDEETQFGFDTQDIEEDMSAATISKAWVDAFYPLYTGTPAGKSKASPGGKPNTNMIPNKNEIPETGAANQAMTAAGPMGGPQAPEQVITKDQLLRLLADKGVLPEWMMNDERMMVLDTAIHISKEGHDNDFTSFVWEKGILKEKRLPPIVIDSTMRDVDNIPYAERIKGGPGSGHKGHKGRPGLVGGGLPGKGSFGIEPVRKGKYVSADGKVIRVGDIIADYDNQLVGEVIKLEGGKVFFHQGDMIVYSNPKDLNHATNEQPTKFVDSYKDVSDSEFGKGYMILGDNSLVDITNEFGTGTNDHVGFAVAADNYEKFGMTKNDAVMFLRGYISLQAGEGMIGGWEKIFNSGAIRVREFGDEIAIETGTLDNKTLRRLQRLYDDNKLGISIKNKIIWSSYEVQDFINTDYETFLSSKYVVNGKLKEFDTKSLIYLKALEDKVFEDKRNIKGKPIPATEVNRGARITRNTLRDELERWRKHPILSKYAPTEEEIADKINEIDAKI